MDPLLIGGLGILAFLILIMFRMPIAYAMALVGFLGYSYLSSMDVAFRVVSKDIYSTFSSYSLSVAPMFIFMGLLAFRSGLGTTLFSFSYKLVGHLPGGLAMATQATCALFGAICGSSTATAATIGSISIPEMRKYKYNDSLSTASVAAGGALGVLIPPSVIFIVYGIASEQSIGQLFAAGVIPGIILTLLYMITIYFLTLKNPSLGPAGPRSSWKERIFALWELWEVALIMIISLGGLFAGWFTPTESGAIGAGSVLAFTLVQKRLSWQGFSEAVLETTRTTAMIMLLIGSATIFGRFMAVSRVPFELATWVGIVELPPFVVMLIILGISLILGCFIDALALVMLTTPIFYPVVVNTLGYDPIWFGVVMVIVVSMGVITPPVGMNVYVIKGVAPEIPLEVIFKGIWPFLIAQVVFVVLLLAFPSIATFLPNALY